MKKYCDMHMHTTYSDGTESVDTLFKLAQKRNLSAITITDHDYFDSFAEINFLSRKYSIETLVAVEISTSFNNKDIHILAYGLDSENKELKLEVKKIRDDRLFRAKKICENLKTFYNIDLDFNIVLKYGKENLGRPHIAQALIDQKIVKDLKEAFNKYLHNNSQAFVPKAKFFTEEALNLINIAKGVSVVAHFGRYEEDISTLDYFANKGLNGIEVYHPSHRNIFSKKMSEKADELNLLKTGGSDFHGHHSSNDLNSEHVPYEYFENLKTQLNRLNKTK